MDRLDFYLALSYLRNAHLTHNTDTWINKEKGAKIDWLNIAFPDKRKSKTNSQWDFIRNLINNTKVFTFVKTINRNGKVTEIYKIARNGRLLLEDMMIDSEIHAAVEIDFNLQRKISYQLGLK